MSSPSPAKKERREVARERARAEREANERRERRNKWLIQGGFIVGLLAIVVVVVLVITTVPPSTQTEAGPRNMISDGILLAGEGGEITAVETPGIPAGGEPVPTEHEDDGIAHIVTYLDYGCPLCRSFEEANGAYIESLVESGEATLEVHPISILDRFFQGTRYSTRSANAAACVANYAPESFLDVSEAFFSNQPAEGTSGLSNEQLAQIAAEAGAASDEVEACITGEDFAPWVQAASDRATQADLPGTDGIRLQGTPTVLVNGQQYEGGVDFQSFVESVVQPDAE